MAQLSDDCFAFDGPLLPLEKALDLLAERVSGVVEAEHVALDSAVGRVLAEDVAATQNVPPYRNSAVDGYAIFHDDLATDEPTTLRVMGRVAAGHPLDGDAKRGHAVRIFTGAPMPTGPDTVMMQEDCRDDGATVLLQPGIKKGANVRSAGEDVAIGDVVLKKGRRLSPQEIGILAAQGATLIPVCRPLRVALLSTGDEVVEPGTPLPMGKLYDSNRVMLKAIFSEMGFDLFDLGIIPDNQPVIENALKEAAENADAIVTSGGMSTGEEDHIKAAIESLGTLNFWRLAIKPGRPVGLGQISAKDHRSVPVIGLPGNPVAAYTTFSLLGRPLLQILSGQNVVPPARVRALADFDYSKKKDRREFVRVKVASWTSDGTPVLEKYGRSGAAILSSLVGADGFAELNEDVTRVEKGTLVAFLPFAEITG